MIGLLTLAAALAMPSPLDACKESGDTCSTWAGTSTWRRALACEVGHRSSCEFLHALGLPPGARVRTDAADTRRGRGGMARLERRWTRLDDGRVVWPRHPLAPSWTPAEQQPAGQWMIADGDEAQRIEIAVPGWHFCDHELILPDGRSWALMNQTRCDTPRTQTQLTLVDLLSQRATPLGAPWDGAASILAGDAQRVVLHTPAGTEMRDGEGTLLASFPLLTRVALLPEGAFVTGRHEPGPIRLYTSPTDPGRTLMDGVLASTSDVQTTFSVASGDQAAWFDATGRERGRLHAADVVGVFEIDDELVVHTAQHSWRALLHDRPEAPISITHFIAPQDRLTPTPPPGPTLHGRVTLDQEAAAGATVELHHDFADLRVETTTDDLGAYSFPELPRGDWTAVVRRGSHGNIARVADGSTEVVFDLVHGRPVRGQVLRGGKPVSAGRVTVELDVSDTVAHLDSTGHFSMVIPRQALQARDKPTTILVEVPGQAPWYRPVFDGFTPPHPWGSNDPPKKHLDLHKGPLTIDLDGPSAPLPEREFVGPPLDIEVASDRSGRLLPNGGMSARMLLRADGVPTHVWWEEALYEVHVRTTDPPRAVWTRAPTTCATLFNGDGAPTAGVSMSILYPGDTRGGLELHTDGAGRFCLPTETRVRASLPSATPYTWRPALPMVTQRR